jgi:hypothetical protein
LAIFNNVFCWQMLGNVITNSKSAIACAKMVAEMQANDQYMTPAPVTALKNTDGFTIPAVAAGGGNANGADLQAGGSEFCDGAATNDVQAAAQNAAADQATASASASTDAEAEAAAAATPATADAAAAAPVSDQDAAAAPALGSVLKGRSIAKKVLAASSDDASDSETKTFDGALSATQLAAKYPQKVLASKIKDTFVYIEAAGRIRVQTSANRSFLAKLFYKFLHTNDSGLSTSGESDDNDEDDEDDDDDEDEDEDEKVAKPASEGMRSASTKGKGRKVPKSCHAQEEEQEQEAAGARLDEDLPTAVTSVKPCDHAKHNLKSSTDRGSWAPGFDLADNKCNSCNQDMFELLKTDKPSHLRPALYCQHLAQVPCMCPDKFALCPSCASALEVAKRRRIRVCSANL